MALPLTILYEISIGVSWLAIKTEEETTNLKTD
jgi:Sec-independent protein secretion pathway component TatC